MSRQQGVVASPGESRLQVLEEELSSLRMEHQLLQLEKSAKEAELQKFRQRIDTDIEFRMPRDSGLESFGSKPMSSVVTSPTVVQESTPVRSTTSGRQSTEATPGLPRGACSSQSLTGRDESSPGNPFREGSEALTHEKFHKNLISFTIRGVGGEGRLKNTVAAS